MGICVFLLPLSMLSTRSSSIANHHSFHGFQPYSTFKCGDRPISFTTPRVHVSPLDVSITKTIN